MSQNHEPRQLLQQELRKLFQYDASDLDFGIYRILNRKKKQIEQFIEKDLLDAVNEGLKAYQAGDKMKFEDQLEEARNKIPPQAFDDQGRIKPEFDGFEDVKKYKEAQTALQNLSVGIDTEKKIYNDLYTFFSRYYDDGDFVTRRRISTRDPKYAIPYNGEEVLLHWANKDQYYIKTGEHFTSYKFDIDGKAVWFKVAYAETEKDNVKESENRYFILRPEKPLEVNEEENELTVWFEYRPLKDDEEERWLKVYNDCAEKPRKTLDRQALCIAYNEWIRHELTGDWKTLLSRIPPNKDRPLLYIKLNHYTGKNTTDYFIHKDLKSFLERELEFYLKNEVIRVDDFIEDDTGQAMEIALIRAKVVRSIAGKIIEFLSQIENFQKKLFEKKKFVVDTHYCFTLDRVPEELYDVILKNKKQLEHWEELYAMKQWSGDLKWDGKWTKAFLKEYPFMMVDTRWFDEEFKFELLASFDDLDDVLDGLLMNSENYQSINLLKSKYRKRLKCIYIDPPYNSKSTEIIYKNSYKHSSWLSLIENRVSLSKDVLRDDAVYVVAIDENEQERLGLMLSELNRDKETTCVTIIHNPGGIQGNNFSYSHEYAIFVYPPINRVIGLENREEEADIRPLRDVSTGEHLREDAANCFYPILVKDKKIVGFGDVCEDSFHPESPNEMREDGVMEVYPIDSQGNERKWVFARNTVESIIDELSVEYNAKRKIYDIIRRKTNFNFKTAWTNKKYNANIFGSKVLNNLIPDNTFTFPKSVFNVRDCIYASTHDSKDSITLDYFAGSGTTAHAILNLNKEDDGNRKYILVEMGYYFDTVMKPRIQKVVFSNNWKDGVPQNKDGQSHAFKYHFIESYEDALNNIDFKNPEDTQEALKFKDYIITYMLDFETQGVSAALLRDNAFETPFDYKLNIQRGHESPKEETVDLVETFHYLIGLRVQTLRRYGHQNRKYVVSTGQTGDEDAVEGVCIIWRNTKDLDLDAEAKWLQKEIIKDQTFDRIYINGISKIKDAEPVEITFREKMFEDVT